MAWAPSSGGSLPTAGPRRGRFRWVFAGIGVAIVLVGIVLLTLSFEPRAFGISSSPGFPYGGGFFGVFLLLWGSLLLARVAWWTARRNLRADGGPPGRRFDPAIRVARERYARGEISREQFEQIVNDLRRPPPPGPLP